MPIVASAIVGSLNQSRLGERSGDVGCGGPSWIVGISDHRFQQGPTCNTGTSPTLTRRL